MRWLMSVSFLLFVCLSGSGQTPSPGEQELRYDEATLRSANIKMDSAHLLQFFRNRTLSEEQQTGISELVKQLGSPSYKIRTRATSEVLKYRDLAIPFLINGLESEKQEVVSRSNYCLSEITQSSESPVVLAAVRVLASKKNDQAVSVLLGYLPFTSNHTIIDQIRSSLKHLVAGQKSPDQEVVNALTDTMPIKRLAAGEALAKHKTVREKVLQLLKDPNLEVRLYVALALARAQETQAVPVLISLLDNASIDLAWQAEDTLLRVAGEFAPEVYLSSKAKPAEVRKAWEDWWQNHKGDPKKVNLAGLTERAPTLGYTLISQMGLRGGLNGEVVELDKDGKTQRWKITGLRYPVDARVIRPNRVLIAEYLSQRVTERNFEGKVLWSFNINTPVYCQRLKNGQTFIISRQELVIADRAGKRIFQHQRQGQSFVAGQMLNNGQIVYVDSGGQVIRIDRNGKELARFFAGNVYSTGGNIEVLPNGRILVPHYRENKVVEYSPTGKRLWEAKVQYPSSVCRLANGNTLVVSLTQRKILELSPLGQIVWQHNTQGRPWCAQRR